MDFVVLLLSFGLLAGLFGYVVMSVKEDFSIGMDSGETSAGFTFLFKSSDCR